MDNFWKGIVQEESDTVTEMNAAQLAQREYWRAFDERLDACVTQQDVDALHDAEYEHQEKLLHAVNKESEPYWLPQAQRLPDGKIVVAACRVDGFVEPLWLSEDELGLFPGIVINAITHFVEGERPATNSLDQVVDLPKLFV